MARTGEIIPAAPVKKLVIEYLSAYDMELDVLAEKAGIGYETLQTAIYHPGVDRETMSFTTADALFCAMGRPGLWQSPEFSDIYQGIQFHLKPWEVELLEKAGEPVTCYKGHPKSKQSSGSYVCRTCVNGRRRVYDAKKRAAKQAALEQAA